MTDTHSGFCSRDGLDSPADTDCAKDASSRRILRTVTQQLSHAYIHKYVFIENRALPIREVDRVARIQGTRLAATLADRPGFYTLIIVNLKTMSHQLYIVLEYFMNKVGLT